jgi:FG-GAP repeat
MAPTGLVVIGAAATPAMAATACTTADSYAHHTVSPANASGGALVAGAKFGAAVAMGDFNKDGFADVAVGAPSDTVNGTAAGTVSVFPGSANGIGATGVRLSQTSTGWGNEAGDRFGAALAAGDFNKDGYADLAIGVPGEAAGSAAKAGGVAVFLGKAAGLTTGSQYGQSVGGGSDEANDAFGSALAAGDFNGDGYADLAIGAPGEAPNSDPAGGLVYVYKGSSSGVVTGWSVTQTDAGGSTEAGDQFGAALAAGNVTGSSHADLVVGAPGEAPGSNPVSGNIYVIPGAADGKGTGFGKTQAGNGGSNEAGDRMGAALAVGNFDKDSYADIAVGVPGEAPDTAPAGGSLLILPGAATQVGVGYWVQEADGGEPIAAGDGFATVLATGDVDGDGYADLLVGAPGKAYGTATGAGTAYLFRGRPREADSTRSLKTGRRIAQSDVAEGNEASDAFGSAVALGDVTGDGKADGVIGSSGEAPAGQPRSGLVHQLAKLAPAAASVVSPESFTPTAAMQASMVPGGSTATLEYAYTDNIGRLLHGHQPDPTNVFSVQWTVISGAEAYAGTPAMAEQADGRLQILAHNVAGTGWAVTQATKEPPAWGPWAAAEGAIKSHIGVARQADGRLVGFGVDAAGVLWALQQTSVNGPYASWMSLGVTGFAGTPVAVAVSGGIRIFALDAAGELRTVLFANGALSGCTGLSDPGLTGTPAVVVYPGSVLRVFVRAADGTILTKKQDGTGTFPTAWEPLGTFTTPGSPSALISPTTGITEVVARGADGAIYNTGETVQGSGVWRDWAMKTVPGDLLAATDPTAFGYTAGANGPTWAFLYRSSDNQTRIYTLNTPFSVALRSGGTPAPTFTGATLPAPPK